MMNKKVQEAWDIVAEYLAKEHPMYAACYFIDERDSDGKLRLHIDEKENILESTKKYDEMKGEKR